MNFIRWIVLWSENLILCNKNGTHNTDARKTITENLPKFASIFVTTAIHKTSYNGQFHYGRNFYAKDADELNISLSVLNNRKSIADGGE